MSVLTMTATIEIRIDLDAAHAEAKKRDLPIPKTSELLTAFEEELNELLGLDEPDSEPEWLTGKICNIEATET